MNRFIKTWRFFTTTKQHGNAFIHDYHSNNRALIQCTSPSQLERLILTTPEFNTVNLCTAVKGMSKLKSTNKICLQKLLSLSLSLSFSPREISNLFHSLSKLRLGGIPPHLVTKFLKSDLSQFRALDLSTVLYAVAVSKSSSAREVCAFVSDHLNNNNHMLTFFDSQSISNSLWAFATVKFTPEQLMKQITREIVSNRSLKDFNTLALSNMVWAYATLGWKDDKLLLSVCCELNQRFSTNDGNPPFHLQALSNLMWGFAMLNFQPDCHVVNTMARAALPLVKQETKTRPWITLLWSFACLDALHLESVQELIQETLLSSRIPLDESDLVSAQQRQQILLAYSYLPNHQQHKPLVSSSFPSATPCHPQSSKIHLQVYRHLCAEFTDLQNEAMVMPGVWVDMFLPSRHVVIEVDGPAHFLNDAVTPNGSTLFKRRLLEKGGFKWYSVPAIRFDLLFPHDQLVFLRQLAERIKMGENES